MRVSRRELTLLIALLCIGAAYLLYTFAFAPLFKEITAARENYLYSQTRMNTYRQTVESYDIAQLQAEQKKQLEAVEEVAKPLLPYIDDSEIAAFIDQLALAQNIRTAEVVFNQIELYDTAGQLQTMPSMTYPLKQAAEAFRADNSNTQGTWVPQAPADPAAGGTGAAPLPPEQTLTVVARQTIDIQFNGVTYPQLFGFMHQLDAAGRTIYLSGMIIGEGTGEAGGLNATLTFSFVQADKLTGADTGLAEVTIPAGAGKTDPFAGNTPAVVPQPQETQPENG